MLAILLILLTELIISFRYSRNVGIRFKNHCSVLLQSHASVSLTLGESNNFDSDFADMMSKPLPEWFKEQKEEQDRQMRELEKNKERIIKEFKQKYEVVDEEQKTREYDARRQQRTKSKPLWLSEVFGSTSKVELDENNEKTTRQKWKEFLNEEEKETGLTFPGFFEVFPELKVFKWPIWAKTKKGGVIKCEVDSDCVFPQACCPHPILPGDKFCCTGFGRRAMVPAYQTRQITVSPDRS